MVQTKINGIPLESYKCDLLEYTVGASDFSKGYMLPSARIIPAKISSHIGLRAITLLLDFVGESDHDITMAISRMTADLRKEAHLLLPDGFYYWCEFGKCSAPKRKAPWIQQVKFTLYGFCHGPMQYETVAQSQTVVAAGNYETPAILHIIPDDGVDEVTVCGVTIRNLSGAVTIDGVKTTIKDDAGLNKFRDADMTEWPKLQPGENEITVSDGVVVEIGYYPIYQ